MLMEISLPKSEALSYVVERARVLAPLAPSPLVSLLGLEFSDLDAAAAATLIASRPEAAPFSYVVTPNADHLVRLSRQPALRELYQDASMRLLDSRVVARTARLIGLSAPTVAPGSDLTEHLLARHLHPGERVTVIGMRPAHLSRLVARYGLAPPAHIDPPVGFERNPEQVRDVVEFVLANPARLVFLAVGSPRQEQLAAALRATGRATGTGLCIGASLEFLAGVKPRAPVWMQQAGMEWLHRLASEPRRLTRRYLLDNPPIFRLLLAERLARRSARAVAPEWSAKLFRHQENGRMGGQQQAGPLRAGLPED